MTNFPTHASHVSFYIRRGVKMLTVKCASVDFFSEDMKTMWSRILAGRANLEISENPDFVICGCYGLDYLKYGDAPIRIYYYQENVFPDFNQFDYAAGFHNINFNDRHLCIPYPMGWDYHKLIGKDNSGLESSMANRKFCNFIYNNQFSGAGAKLRTEFCKKLSEYKRVDCPGKVMNNMPDAIEPRNSGWPHWYKSKLEFIKNYKFTMAFENSQTDGYTTEKLIQPLLANSIPIYWGNRKVSEMFNPAAFINASDFDNFDQLMDKIIELDQDDAKYLEMLRQPPVLVDSVPNYDELFADFLMNIFENGYKNRNSICESISPYGREKQKMKTNMFQTVSIN